MLKALIALGLICSSIQAIAVIWAISMMMAFQGEAYRGDRVPDVQAKLQLIAFLIAITPAILTGILVFRWAVYSKMPSLGISFLPLALGLVAGFSSKVLFEAGSKKGAPGRSKIREEEAKKSSDHIKTIRETVDKGSASACMLLSMDPNANYEDFKKCRKYIESLQAPEKRIREELHVLSGNFCGIMIANSRKATPILQEEDETWFLRTVFTDYLYSFKKLGEDDSRSTLLDLVQKLREPWTNAAVIVAVREFFPTLQKRLRDEADWTDEMFEPSQKIFFSSNRTENNLIAKAMKKASHQVQMTELLDHATTRLKPKLEAKGFQFVRKSYGSGLYDILSEFKSGKGELLNIIIWDWYPREDDEPGTESEPMLAAEMGVGQEKWSSNFDSSWKKSPADDPRPKLQFRFKSSQAEIDQAIDSLLHVIEKHITDSN